MVAPACGLQLRERAGRVHEIGADQHGRCEHGKRIKHEMPARRPEAIAHRSPKNSRFDFRRLGGERASDQPRIGRGVLAKSDDALDATALRALLQPSELRIVAVDHRGPAARKAAEDLGLRVGDGFHRSEELEMHRLDRGNDRDLRLHQASERLDLTRMIHAELKDGIPHAGGTAGKRQGHPPMIVVRRDGGVRLALLGEGEP
jgi:hypothetical protein